MTHCSNNFDSAPTSLVQATAARRSAQRRSRRTPAAAEPTRTQRSQEGHQSGPDEDPLFSSPSIPLTELLPLIEPPYPRNRLAGGNRPQAEINADVIAMIDQVLDMLEEDVPRNHQNGNGANPARPAVRS